MTGSRERRETERKTGMHYQEQEMTVKGHGECRMFLIHRTQSVTVTAYSCRFMRHLHSWDCILLLNLFLVQLATNSFPFYSALAARRKGDSRHFVSYDGRAIFNFCEWKTRASLSTPTVFSPLKPVCGTSDDNILWGKNTTLPFRRFVVISEGRPRRNSIWNSLSRGG